MADNVIASAGTEDGATFAADDIGGVLYPRTKVTWGPDGTANDTDDASGKRLPVKIAESVVIQVGDNSATLSVDDGAGSLTVDGTVAATQSGTWNVGTVTTVSTITNVVHVDDNASTISVDDGGATLTVDGTVTVQDGGGAISVDDNGSSLTVDGSVTATAVGDVAHDSADSGNPVKMGAKATTALSGVTLVANNDRTNLMAGVDGVQIVRANSNLESLSRGTAAITDGSSTSVIAAAGAGVKTYITDVIIANSSATFVTVDLRDGTAGSVMATFPVPATSGCVHHFASPLGGTANTAVAADPSAAASTVTVTLVGFKSKI